MDNKTKIYQDTLELIDDFYITSEATTAEGFRSELKTFAFNVLLSEKDIEYQSLSDAINLLNSLGLKSLTDARDMEKPPVPKGYKKVDCFYPLRKRYIASILSKESNKSFMFKGRDGFVCLEYSSTNIIDGVEIYEMFIEEHKEFKKQKFKVVGDILVKL